MPPYRTIPSNEEPVLANYKINIYLLSQSTALAAKIFTMKSLFMLAV
jgi:hypothetical protein